MRLSRDNEVSAALIFEQRKECAHQRRVAAIDGQVLNEDSGLLALPSAHRDNHAVGARTAAVAAGPPGPNRLSTAGLSLKVYACEIHKSHLALSALSICPKHGVLS